MRFTPFAKCVTHSRTFRVAAKCRWALPRGNAPPSGVAVAVPITTAPAFTFARQRKKAAQSLTAMHSLFVVSADTGLPAGKGDYAVAFSRSASSEIASPFGGKRIPSSAAFAVTISCAAAFFSAIRALRFASYFCSYSFCLPFSLRRR